MGASGDGGGTDRANGAGAELRRHRLRGLWFYLGLVALIAAMAPPLDSYAERSLSAHMAQHVILMAIAPLFLVLADPWETLVVGLPERVRNFGSGAQATARQPTARSSLATPEAHDAVGARHGPRHEPGLSPGHGPNHGPGHEPVRRHVTLATWRWPWTWTWTWVAILVTVVQSLVMWAWHIPALYDLAVRVDGVHAIEHLTFLGSGIWFWWAIGATGSRRNGMAALVVFIAALPGTALGAALMLAPQPWFPAYPDLQDQQVAGAIMWSVAGAVYLAGAVVLFLSWLSRMDERTEGVQKAMAPQNA